MPKIVDHDQRRQELIEEAALVIAERGLENTTLRDVAKSAGFSANLVAHYFKNKDDLLWHVHRFVGQRAARRFMTSSDHSLYSLVESVLPYTSDTIVQWKVTLFFWSRAINDPDLSTVQNELMPQIRSDIAGIIREQQDAGQVRPDIDIPIAVERLLNLTYSLSVRILMERNKYTKAFSRKLIRSSLSDLMLEA